ncbi:M15 family metallopeptidase [Demequina aurantiaca]|uniref:M15 family metallopeptidase n=1 Tax=Demequina aurantiaca TaxID=676200 RepID=UPI003D330963
MSHPIRKTTVVTATVALACFGAGYVFTGGAYAFETNRAVGQAVAAARDVDDKRQELEASLARAQSLTNEAAHVATDAQVRTASETLSLATTDALSVAADHDVPVDAMAVDLESATLMRGSTILPPNPATDSAKPAETPDTALSGVVTDDEVSKVLDGDVKDLSSTREVTAKLTEVGLALDESLAKVEASAATVKDATDTAHLVRNAKTLDDAVAQVPASIESAAALLDAIETNVMDSTTISNIHSATAALEGSVISAGAVDRADAAAVTAGFAVIADLATALERSIQAAGASHLAWVDAENERRAALNDQSQEEYAAELQSARDAYAAQNREYVASRSNGWVGTPTEVSGSNGRLASGSLCAVSFAPGQYLQCDAAAALELADAEYFSQTGGHLSMTDSYRSYGLQVTTRARKPSTAAVPGTSNHGWGMAVDLDVASAAWLTANGASFGWVHPAWARPGGSKPEFWHLEYVAPEVGGFVAPEAPEALQAVETALTKE